MAATENYDIIVIGGGTMGRAAAYYCSARHKKVLLLEQTRWDQQLGGSGGFSRMYRVMYTKDWEARHAETAMALWHEIETAAELPLLQTHPISFIGDPGKEDPIEGGITTAKAVMTDMGIPYSYLDNANALRQLYPVLNVLPDSYVCLTQANSAEILVQNSLRAFNNLAVSNGATLIDQARATIDPAPPGAQSFTVRAAGHAYTASKLVICAGGWVNDLLLTLGLVDIRFNLEIWQMTLAYFAADIAQYTYPYYYDFGTISGTNDSFYGFPPMDEYPGMIKTAADFTNWKFKSPSELQPHPDPVILRALSSFVQTRFIGVAAEPQHAETCNYVMSRDQRPVIDLLPRYENIAIFALDSGSWFKFTPLVGRILSDLAINGRTPYDISPFSALRAGIVS